MKEYQRKFQAEWMSMDVKPKAIKKSLESSNRGAARREIQKELRSLHRSDFYPHHQKGTRA